MKTKTTLEYFFTPMRMAIKKSDNKCWRGCGEGGTFIHFVKVQINIAIMTVSLEGPREINRVTIWPIYITPWHYPKNSISYQRDICTPMFLAAVFTILKKWNKLKCISTEECVIKMWYIYTIEYYSAVKKSELINL